MKRLFSMAAAACLLLLAPLTLTACESLPGSGAVGAAINPTADEKALFVAEATFRGALVAVEAAVDSGKLKGENAATVRRYLAQARTALQLARTAYAAGDAAGVLRQTRSATSALGEVGRIVGPGTG